MQYVKNRRFFVDIEVKENPEIIKIGIMDENPNFIDKDVIRAYINEIRLTEEKEDLIEKSILFLKKNFCLDAIGLRLQEGNDYPYYTTLGFSDAFVKAENYLCKKDENGDIIRDENGKPILECLCGEIINQKFEFNHPCYTKRGSFYTVGEIAKAIKCITRGACTTDGFESIAIVPIGYNGVVIGLLQMNHRQRDAFSLGLIQTAEEIAAMLGKVLGGIIKKEQERATKRELLSKNIKNILSELQILSEDMIKKYS
jgi:hypothetical protein